MSDDLRKSVSQLADSAIREFHAELSVTLDRALELGWPRELLAIRSNGAGHARLVTLDHGHEKYVLAEARFETEDGQLVMKVSRAVCIPEPPAPQRPD
jgi:hypothetical protein